MCKINKPVNVLGVSAYIKTENDEWYINGYRLLDNLSKIEIYFDGDKTSQIYNTSDVEIRACKMGI